MPRLLRRRSAWIAVAATLFVALGIGIALSVERARRVEVQLALAPGHRSPRGWMRDDLADAVLERGARVDYHEGFLVPVGAGELEVLVGVRSGALDEATLAEVDAALARGEAREALEDEGFEVATLRVVEPL